jgi:hypothetical protein
VSRQKSRHRYVSGPGGALLVPGAFSRHTSSRLWRLRGQVNVEQFQLWGIPVVVAVVPEGDNLRLVALDLRTGGQP